MPKESLSYPEFLEAILGCGVITEQIREAISIGENVRDSRKEYFDNKKKFAVDRLLNELFKNKGGEYGKVLKTLKKYETEAPKVIDRINYMEHMYSRLEKTANELGIK